MDREEAGLGIRLSPLANEDLRNIWAWNHGRYGLAHADRYRELLLSNIDLLRDQPHLGPKVNGRHPYRGLIIRRNRVAMGISPSTVSSMT
jgi:plasmid stabilization system protein ParE